MMGLTVAITDAGRAALRNADGNGTNAVTVAAVGLSSEAFTPGDAIPAEIKRLTSISGGATAADTIHITVLDSGSDDYSVYGFALYLSDGTLFGSYGQSTVIVEKSAQAMMQLALDIRFADIDATSITFGDANFMNPAATADTLGVVKLATADEVAAGTDVQKVITPATFKSGLDARFGGGAPSSFFKGLMTSASAALLRTALAIKGAALYDAGAGNGLDADLLDGKQGAYYLDYGNLSNAPQSQPISYITGLQAALNALLPLAGGTMSGALTTNGQIYGSSNSVNVNYGPSNGYKASFQGDGNLVVYKGSSVLWDVQSSGSAFSVPVTLNSGLTVTGQVSLQSGVLTIANTSGLQDSLSSKISGTSGMGSGDLAGTALHLTPAASTSSGYDTPQFGWNDSSGSYTSIALATQNWVIGYANAASASKWNTARKLSFTGAATGYANIDGSANVSIGLTIADASLTIAKTSGLQSSLNALLPLAGGTMTGDLTTNGQIYGSSNTVNIGYGSSNGYKVSFQNDGNVVLYNGSTAFGQWQPTKFATSAPAVLSGGLTVSSGLSVTGTVSLPSASLPIAATSGLQSSLSSKISGTNGMGSTDLAGTALHLSPAASTSSGYDTPQFGWNDASGDYTSLALATQNWVTGYANAASASKWNTARTLSFTGAATGSANIDGSANVSIGLTIPGGSISGGYYYKINTPDGLLLVQKFRVDVDTVGTITVSFPIAFSAVPVVTHSYRDSADGVSAISNLQSITATSASFYNRALNSSGWVNSSGTTWIEAIGKA